MKISNLNEKHEGSYYKLIFIFIKSINFTDWASLIMEKPYCLTSNLILNIRKTVVEG